MPVGSGVLVVEVLVDSVVEAEVKTLGPGVLGVVEAEVEAEDGPTEVMSDQFSIDVEEGRRSGLAAEVARVRTGVEDEDEDGGEGEKVVGVPVLMTIGIRQKQFLPSCILRLTLYPFGYTNKASFSAGLGPFQCAVIYVPCCFESTPTPRRKSKRMRTRQARTERNQGEKGL